MSTMINIHLYALQELVIFISLMGFALAISTLRACCKSRALRSTKMPGVEAGNK